METEQITPENVEAYLKQHQEKSLLRFVTVGSVDDGKSTLIGRLLHDTHGVYEDQLTAVKKATSQRGAFEGEEIDFSLFTDGLKAEREQGITIDVAYRYFSTSRRKFIIADTPGHVQYTRNMATGASTAAVGIILIDARLGVLQQSRRHAYIASLLGIPHLLVAVNKMDLRDFEQGVFDAIVKEFSAFAKKLRFKDVKFIPISAKAGDNVVHSSKRTPWYNGGTLLEYLETVPVGSDRNVDDFRFPVQCVIRPNLDYRGFAGEVASGVVRKGDTVMALPSRKTSTVVAIDTFGGEVPSASASMAVTLRLADEIDVSRGDMLTLPGNLPTVGRRFAGHVVWMHERELDTQKSYLMKHTTQLVRVNVEAVDSVTNLETLEDHAATSLGLNDIGKVRFVAHRPIFFDAYEKNRSTGAFVLIDSITNNTVAAGMLLPALTGSAALKEDGTLENSQVSPNERAELAGQKGALVSLDGPGANAFAYLVERTLYDRGHLASVVELDNEDQRAAAVRALVEVGVIVIVMGKSSLGAELQSKYGQSSVLEASVNADAVILQGQELPIQGGRVEALAGKLVDELTSRGLFLD